MRLDPKNPSEATERAIYEAQLAAMTEQVGALREMNASAEETRSAIEALTRAAIERNRVTAPAMYQRQCAKAKRLGEFERKACAFSLLVILASTPVTALLPITEAIFASILLIQVAALIAYAIYARRLDRIAARQHTLEMAAHD